MLESVERYLILDTLLVQSSMINNKKCRRVEVGAARAKTPALGSVSLVLVAYIRLLETHPNDVVSMHECYTYFLLMFRRRVDVSLFAPQMASKGGGRGLVRAGSERHTKPCSSVAEVFKFFGRDLQSG